MIGFLTHLSHRKSHRKSRLDIQYVLSVRCPRVKGLTAVAGALTFISCTADQDGPVSLQRFRCGWSTWSLWRCFLFTPAWLVVGQSEDKEQEKSWLFSEFICKSYRIQGKNETNTWFHYGTKSFLIYRGAAGEHDHVPWARFNFSFSSDRVKLQSVMNPCLSCLRASLCRASFSMNYECLSLSSCLLKRLRFCTTGFQAASVTTQGLSSSCTIENISNKNPFSKFKSSREPAGPWCMSKPEHKNVTFRICASKH